MSYVSDEALMSIDINNLIEQNKMNLTDQQRQQITVNKEEAQKRRRVSEEIAASKEETAFA
jgi:hypothetical protein